MSECHVTKIYFKERPEQYKRKQRKDSEPGLPTQVVRSQCAANNDATSRS